MLKLSAILLAFLSGLTGCVSANRPGPVQVADPDLMVERSDAVGESAAERVSPEVQPFGSQPVMFFLSEGWEKVDKHCVVLDVQPPPAAAMLTAGDLEDAVARHLHMRFRKVVGRYERERLERQWAAPIDTSFGANEFERRSGCLLFEADARRSGTVFLGTWAERAIALRLTLRRIGGDEAVVWTATYRLSRGDGGFPLSPIGAAMGIVRATALAADGDAMVSILGDGLRHVFATLPMSNRL